MKFANVEIAPETILRTREHFAELCRQCIQHAQSGKFFVNNVPEYVADNERRIKAVLAGESDHTFTFAQRAHYLQTGESVPLLAKGRENA